MLIESGKVKLIESLDGNKYRCVIIKAGVTSSANASAVVNGKKVMVKKNYPEKLLIEAASKGLFEMAPCLFRSENEHLRGENNKTDNIVGIFTDTKWDDEIKGVTGVLTLKNGSKFAESFKGKFKELWEKSKSIGLSIFGYGKWLVERLNNEYVATIESIENVTSIDPCYAGNAGGELVELIESQALENFSSNLKENTMKLKAALKKALYDFLIEKGKIEKSKKLEDFTDDQLAEQVTVQEFAELVNKVDAESEPPKADPPKTDPPKSEDPPKGDPPKNEDPPKGDPPKSEDPPKGDPPKKEPEFNTKEAEEVVAEAKRIVKKTKFGEILSESKLPAIAKDKIKARYEKLNYEYDEVTLKQELKDTAEVLAEANPSFLDNQRNGIKMGLEQRDKYQLAMDWLILSSAAKQFGLSKEERKEFAEAGVTTLNSFRRFYEEMTGDVNVTGKYSSEKLAESIETSTFTELLGNSMHRAMMKEYNMSAYNQDWRKIVSIVPRSDYKENTKIYFGGYGDVPVVAEAGPYTATSTPGEEAQKYIMKKRGYTDDLTREAILNDDLGAIRRIPVKMGRAAVRTLYKFVFNQILSNPVMNYDSKTLFHADHFNLLSVALDAAGLEAARSAMYNQKELSSNEAMGLIGKFILVPDSLRKTAYDLTTPAYGVKNDVPEFIQTLQAEPIVVPHMGANEWYFVSSPMDNPTIEIAFLNGQEEPEILAQDNPQVGSVFSNDKITYKLRHEYSGTPENHRGFVKSTFS